MARSNYDDDLAANMKITVGIDPRCVVDLQPLTIEKRALVKQYLNALRESLGENGGILPGSKQISEGPPRLMVWEDNHWRVGYTIQDSRNVFLIRKRIVMIRLIELSTNERR